jgi:glutathione S-transferase
MSTLLHMLPPSVNNLTVRVFLRAAGLPFEETNVWGKTRSPEFLAKVPAHLTPAIEDSDHPRGAMWESCAIMMYLANQHKLEALYPSDPGKRALIDAANFYLTGTLYPLVARATYPRLGFPTYPGEASATEGVSDELKSSAREAAEVAVGEPLEVFNSYFIRGGFIGDGAGPSIADIRLCATLEFLAMGDRPLPDWANEYVVRVEGALGKAYSEPAGDVRGFIAHVKSKA